MPEIRTPVTLESRINGNVMSVVAIDAGNRELFLETRDLTPAEHTALYGE